MNMRIHLYEINKILGFIEQDQNFWPLNFILREKRFYIFTSAKKSSQQNIYYLQNLI